MVGERGDVQERRGHQHAPANLQLPDFRAGDRNEALRLGHVVRDARARKQVDEPLDAVCAGENRDFGSTGIWLHRWLPCR